MKKRILSFFLAVCMLISFTVGSVNVMTATAATSTTTKVGDEIAGFYARKVGYDTSTKSTKILFEHEKSGAKLLVIKNNDLNRGFSIKFNTVADNDKGINHIIEHSVLGGSKKYPSSNILFDVSNTTYVSFVNAFTYQNMTMYPICSKSEDQLLKSTDVYLDAVFNPLLLSDQRIFEREGIRYELADAASDLTYNGIVYNEMQGNMGNIDQAAIMNASKAIYTESNQGNNSGGDPDAITTLTYKEVLATYNKNYHPSNSFMVLYGDLDYEVCNGQAFL